MNKQSSEIFSFELETDSSGDLNILAEKIAELKNNGYKNLTIKIFSDTTKSLDDLGVDKEKFDRVKEKQALPDDVILEFFQCKGSLNDKKISERIKW